METENSNTVDLNQLQACQQEVERWKEAYLRVNADMENIKRRSYKDQELMLNRSMMQLFGDLLPIIDNFDRALAAGANAPDGQLLQGLMLIRKEFASVLERYGVKEMTKLDQFDPELHEALSQQPADATHPAGTII